MTELLTCVCGFEGERGDFDEIGMDLMCPACGRVGQVTGGDHV